MPNLTKFLEIPNSFLHQWSSKVFTSSKLTDAPASDVIGVKIELAVQQFNNTTNALQTQHQHVALEAGILYLLGPDSQHTQKVVMHQQIFNHRDLSTIINPRILKLKEKIPKHCFTLQYCLGVTKLQMLSQKIPHIRQQYQQYHLYLPPPQWQQNHQQKTSLTQIPLRTR